MSQSTAEKIKAAALTEFAQHGLEGGRVDRIAQRAGINKAMIYYHFASKEKLYETVLRQRLATVGHFLGAKLDQVGDLEDLLQEIAGFYASLFAPGDEYRPILLRELAAGGEHFKTALLELTGEIDLPRRLKAMLDRGKREGRYRAVDSRQALVSFIGMNIAYLMAAPVLNEIWELKNEESFRRKRPQAVVDLFLHGLKKR